MGKLISMGWAGPDDPIYKEPLRSYSPHWARSWARSQSAAMYREWLNMFFGGDIGREHQGVRFHEQMSPEAFTALTGLPSDELVIHPPFKAQQRKPSADEIKELADKIKKWFGDEVADMDDKFASLLATWVIYETPRSFPGLTHHSVSDEAIRFALAYHLSRRKK